MNTTPTILVTGLSGLVGSRFQQLFGDQYNMVNLDLTTGVDITNTDQVESVFSAHADAAAILHLAAFTNLNAAYEERDNKDGVCYKVNVLGTKTIAEAAARHSKYLIHISTDYVFDGEKTDFYTEADTPHPIEWYGQTKQWADEEVIKSGVKHVMLRLAFPYLANPMRPDMIAKIRNGLETGTLYPMFADHTITPTFVDDVAQVFDYCIHHQPIGLYHMVGSSSHTDFEIASMVKAIFGYTTEVKPGSLAAYIESSKRPYQKTMKVSNQKLTQEFGLKMKTLEEGLREIKNQLGK